MIKWWTVSAHMCKQLFQNHNMKLRRRRRQSYYVWQNHGEIISKCCLIEILDFSWSHRCVDYVVSCLRQLYDAATRTGARQMGTLHGRCQGPKYSRPSDILLLEITSRRRRRVDLCGARSRIESRRARDFARPLPVGRITRSAIHSRRVTLLTPSGELLRQRWRVW